MLYFPQLLTGTTSQYPMSRTSVMRTLVNSATDGKQVKAADSDASFLEWELDLHGLTTAERLALETLFGNVEGRLSTFTFLDPAANLLLWSEDFTTVVWVKGPMIQFTGNVGDPFAGMRAARLMNSGLAVQQVTQSINAAGWYQYCFSVWVRADSPLDITLFGSAGASQQSSVHRAGPAWSRIAHSGKLTTTDESITHGIVMPATSTIEIFGPQLEAQPAPSGYRRSSGKSGIHPQSRFRDDTLSIVANGPENHTAKVAIVSTA